MKVPKSLRIVGWVFLVFAAFSVWYMVAADYGYGAVSGTYKFREDGETSKLILKKDGTFVQERTRQGKNERVQGTWRRIGEGGVVFSPEFLKVTGQKTRTDGQADGKVQKSFFQLIPSIVLEADRIRGPRFHRALFR